MSLCRLCGKGTFYESDFCPECQEKYRREMAEKGPPAPITTAPFSIHEWADYVRFKRHELREGKSVEAIRAAIYERAKKRQESYDTSQRATAAIARREAEIAKLADEI